jgi:glycosyltransferase involved in cell wall biosynthesis
MSKHQKHRRSRKHAAAGGRQTRHIETGCERDYRGLCEMAVRGDHARTQQMYDLLLTRTSQVRLQALIANDQAALRALAGDTQAARNGFEAALRIDAQCEPARANLELLREQVPGLFETELHVDAADSAQTIDVPSNDGTKNTLIHTPRPSSSGGEGPEVSGDQIESTSKRTIDSPTVRPTVPISAPLTPALKKPLTPNPSPLADGGRGEKKDDQSKPLQQRVSAGARPSIVNVHRSFLPNEIRPVPNGVKVAILSFLFNWPSTGGGIIHTVELAQFLAKAGFDVRHFYAKFPEWGVGTVETKLPFPSQVIEFDASNWNTPSIQSRFRAAVDAYKPDYVIITDSWNFKPLLAEAMQGYPYFLRLQAMECICPLNNVRLLPEAGGQVRQCVKNQLADPATCAHCLLDRGHQSGGLHQAERQLSGVDTDKYSERLLRAFRDAEAVLVVNPLTQGLVGPFAKRTRVVTAGMDPARFPWPSGEEVRQHGSELGGKKKILFAGLVEELMKGFHVVHEACARLWRSRTDFELIATGDPAGAVDEFTRFVGWVSQKELPRQLRAADMLVMPTIAQEALGRTAVEAMAAGRPVIASRLGGLPFTVIDGKTGLLCNPGDPADLAEKIEVLLDHPELRERLGLEGRLGFVRDYSWEGIVERHYVPLLSPSRSQLQSLSQHRSPRPSPLAARGEGVTGGLKLSLIVSVLESYEVLRRQLMHLNSVLTDECELIVVDDGSEPSLLQTCDSVAKSYAFRLIFTGDRRPWTQPKARNLAASVAHADRLVFFDIDHVITRSVIDACLNYRGDKLHWRRRPGILDENGSIVTDQTVLEAHGLAHELPDVHVNSFMIRRDLFDLLGGYDERFCSSYGGDDVDFNDRYARLCELGVAKRDEVMGEGFAYPDPSLDGGKMFHSLPRVV